MKVVLFRGGMGLREYSNDLSKPIEPIGTRRAQSCGPRGPPRYRLARPSPRSSVRARPATPQPRGGKFPGSACPPANRDHKHGAEDIEQALAGVEMDRLHHLVGVLRRRCDRHGPTKRFESLYKAECRRGKRPRCRRQSTPRAASAYARIGRRLLPGVGHAQLARRERQLGAACPRRGTDTLRW